jgi:hypothetical protein
MSPEKKSIERLPSKIIAHGWRIGCNAKRDRPKITRYNSSTRYAENCNGRYTFTTLQPSAIAWGFLQCFSLQGVERSAMQQGFPSQRTKPLNKS